MRPLTVLLSLLLFAATGCPTSTPRDDDDDSTATDDDDVVQEEFDFTFDPPTAVAGAIGTYDVDLGGMDPAGATECCNEHIDLLQTFDPPPPGGITGFFFFGILGDGVATWGMESETQIGDGTVTIAPIGALETITAGAPAASDSIEAPLAYDVYQVEVSDPHTVISAQTTSLAPATAFDPAVWLVEPDGWTLAAFSSTLGEIDSGQHFASVYVPDPGTWFVRVMDFGTQGEAGWDYDLDLQTEVVDPTPSVVAEIEPNDDDPWQYLGSLGSGFWQLTGATATAGWTQTPSFAWTGDLDAFSFQVSTDAQVEFELGWDDSANDLDMVVYSFATGTPNVGGFGDDVVSGAGATLNFPETTSVQLNSDQTYVVMVANFDGEDDVAWTLDLRVLP